MKYDELNDTTAHIGFSLYSDEYIARNTCQKGVSPMSAPKEPIFKTPFDSLIKRAEPIMISHEFNGVSPMASPELIESSMNAYNSDKKKDD